MARKVSLPLTRFAAPASGRPTVDAMRKRLGGRAQTEAGAGDVVGLAAAGDVTSLGVVLHASGDELHVWVAEGIVRRTKRSLTTPATTTRDLAELAGDARSFAALHEGQRVRYQTEADGFTEGTLIEKCRFGALIVRADDIVVAVGFRRIWPLAASTAGSPPN